MKQKDHVIIKLMEIGCENLEGLDLGRLPDFLDKKNATEIEKKFAQKVCLRFFETRDNTLSNSYILKPEFYFDYLDYLELKEARKNSQHAWWFSICAILISVASLIVSIFGKMELGDRTIKALECWY